MAAMEKKDKNLNVPNLRFPEFSGEWEKCKIKQVCDIATGNKNTQDKSDDGIYPFYVRSQTVERINSWSFDGEAILTAGDGVGVGKVFHYSTGKIGVHQRVYILSNFTCDSKYLFHYFSSRFYGRVKRMSAKNSVDSVRMEMIADMPIYLASNDEQHKIGNLMSLLNERIETQKKIIEKLESLIKGLCSSLFDKNKYDSFVRLGDISEITNGNSDVQDASLSYSDGMYPFFDRSEDIKFLPEYLLDKEAIIYPGEGSEFYPRYYNGKFALHQRCYAIYDIAPNFATRYLYFFCKTQNSYFVRNAVGSTVASLRLDTFKRLNIPNIPIELQKTYVQLLDKIETKIVDNKIVLKKYEEQKRYLLSNLFI